MVPWKLFRKSKDTKEEANREVELPPFQEAKEEIQPSEQEPVETEEKQEDKPVTEYHETLYSKGTAPKKTESTPSEEPWKRKSWENASTIEKNVDKIDPEKSEQQHKTSEIEDIEQKVDRLLAKKKI